MPKTIRLTLLAIFSFVLAASFSLPKVLAHGDSDLSGRDSNQSLSDEDETVTEDQNDEVAEDEANEVEDESEAEIHHQRSLGEAGKLSREEVHRKVCELRQKAVTHRAGVLNTSLTRHLALFDAVYGRVKTFVSDNSISVEGYDELVAAVDGAQAAAKAAVDKVGAQTPHLDCNHDNNRQDVVDFRSNLEAAIKALKNYLNELKDFVGAVRDAAGSDE